MKTYYMQAFNRGGRWTLFSLILAVSGCTMIGPVSMPSGYRLEEQRVAVVTDVENPPVFLRRGPTVFQNEMTDLASVHIDVRGLVIQESTNVLIERGINAETVPEELQERFLRLLETKKADQAYSLMRDHGFETVAFLRQGIVREGLRAESGVWVSRHGIWKLQTPTGRGTYVVLPVNLVFFDTGSGKLLARPGGQGDGFYFAQRVEFLDSLNTFEDLTVEQQGHLAEEYRNKFLMLLDDQLRDMGI